MTIRILHVVTDLSFSGGDHIYLEKLLTHLATDRAGEFELHVAEIRGHGNGNNGGVYDRLTDLGIRFHQMPRYVFATMTLAAPAFLRQVVEMEGIDVIHSHTLYSELCCFICRHGSEVFRREFADMLDMSLAEEISESISLDWTTLYRDIIPFRGWPDSTPRIDGFDCRWVATKHITTLISLSIERDLETRYGQTPEVLATANAINERIQVLLSTHADLVVAINSKALDLWKDMDIDTVHIPVSIADGLVAEGHPAQGTGDPRDGITFVYAGRVASKKNPDMLVRAFGIHSIYRPQDSLIFFGDGPLLGKCREMAAAIPQITFAGHRDRNDLLVELPVADAFCLFSSEEGLPLAIQEAMGLGIPVLTTLVGGVGELIADGETGLVAAGPDLGEVVACLARFAAMPEEDRLRIGQAGRQVIGSRIGAKASFEQYAAEYTRVVEKEKSSALVLQ